MKKLNKIYIEITNACNLNCSFCIKNKRTIKYMTVNEFIFILISYYSITFATKCFNAIKKDKTINLRQFIKNYFFCFLVKLNNFIITIFSININFKYSRC